MIALNEIGLWEKIKVIGKGGSSTVFKAKSKVNGGLMAVKEIQTDGMSKEQIMAIGGEVETIKNLSHENIIQYLGTQQTLNHIYIFLEYADRGSLRQYYQKHGALKEAQVSFCLSQTLLGLQYLHGFGIAHRDVKGANILLTKKSVMKLADFGASKRFDTESIVSGLKGTPHWMAPEVIKGVPMTDGWFKADVWSLGCTAVELVTGKIPYSMYDNPMTAMYHIASGEAPSMKEVNPSEYLISFVQICCHPNPNERPSVDTLLQHPFIASTERTRKAVAVRGQQTLSPSGLPSAPDESSKVPPNPTPQQVDTDTSIAVTTATPSTKNRPQSKIKKTAHGTTDGGYIDEEAACQELPMGAEDEEYDQDDDDFHVDNDTNNPSPPPLSPVYQGDINNSQAYSNSNSSQYYHSVQTYLDDDEFDDEATATYMAGGSTKTRHSPGLSQSNSSSNHPIRNGGLAEIPVSLSQENTPAVQAQITYMPFSDRFTGSIEALLPQHRLHPRKDDGENLSSKNSEDLKSSVGESALVSVQQPVIAEEVPSDRSPERLFPTDVPTYLDAYYSACSDDVVAVASTGDALRGVGLDTDDYEYEYDEDPHHMSAEEFDDSLEGRAISIQDMKFAEMDETPPSFADAPLAVTGVSLSSTGGIKKGMGGSGDQSNGNSIAEPKRKKKDHDETSKKHNNASNSENRKSTGISSSKDPSNTSIKRSQEKARGQGSMNKTGELVNKSSKQTTKKLTSYAVSTSQSNNAYKRAPAGAVGGGPAVGLTRTVGLASIPTISDLSMGSVAGLRINSLGSGPSLNQLDPSNIALLGPSSVTSGGGGVDGKTRKGKGIRYSKSAGVTKISGSGGSDLTILPPMEHKPSLPSTSAAVMSVPLLHLRHIQSAPAITRVGLNHVLPPLSVSPNPSVVVNGSSTDSSLLAVNLGSYPCNNNSNSGKASRYRKFSNEKIVEEAESSGGILAPRRP